MNPFYPRMFMPSFIDITVVLYIVLKKAFRNYQCIIFIISFWRGMSFHFKKLEWPFVPRMFLTFGGNWPSVSEEDHPREH